MKVIVGARQAGKTHVLVEQVKGGVQRADGSWSRVIVTVGDHEAIRLRQVYHLDRNQVFSAQDWQRARFGMHSVSTVYVDNIDLWFYNVFGQMPSTATSTELIATQTLDTAQAIQRAIRGSLDMHEIDGDLLEDEDGAPYPEEVQELARELRLKMREVDGLLENMQRQLVVQQNKAERNEQGLISMLAPLIMREEDRDEQR